MVQTTCRSYNPTTEESEEEKEKGIEIE